jgi:hypothetical protein
MGLVPILPLLSGSFGGSVAYRFVHAVSLGPRTISRGVAEQGASPLAQTRGQGARKVRTLDIPFPRLVLAHRHPATRDSRRPVVGRTH